jgi:hypothetical protein
MTASKIAGCIKMRKTLLFHCFFEAVFFCLLCFAQDIEKGSKIMALSLRLTLRRLQGNPTAF